MAGQFSRDGFPLDPQSMMEVKTFEAQKVFIYAQESLTEFPGAAQNVELDLRRRQDVARQLVATIKTMLVSGRIADNSVSETVKWPDSSWQMFKERHFPEWFKQRFPVRWHVKIIETQRNHYFVCPHIATDPQSQHVRFMATGTPLAGEMRSRY